MDRTSMPPRPAWYGWVYLLLISLGAFGGALLALLVTGPKTDLALVWMLRCGLVMALVIAITAFYLHRDGLTWSDYGVSLRARMGIAGAGGLLLGSLLALLWAGIVAAWSPLEWRLNPTFRADALLFGTAATLMIGIAEEVGYRSYGLDRLYVRYGAATSVLAPSALFALVHMLGGVPWLAGLLVVGSCSVLYGTLMLVTRNLPFVAAFHIANNLIQDALLRTGPGSIGQPVFADVEAAQRHQVGIWACMALLNLAVAAYVWTRRGKVPRVDAPT
jgi:membrane protease YdiL (CAAX protease family)